MRLWHIELLPVLPRKQLLGQWRECCLIAKNIALHGKPGHILVNRIMDYPMEDFFTYGYAVFKEMHKRGYKADFSKFAKHLFTNFSLAPDNLSDDPFYNWHDYRYMAQCFFNLQEKRDCGGISGEEWNKICLFYNEEYCNK